MIANLKIVILFLLLIFLSISVKSQRIDLSMPDNANLAYSFVLNKGLKQDTIQSGVFSFSGSATINIPDKHKDYRGIGSLRVKGQPIVNFVVNNENFSAKANNGVLEFTNSKENSYLYAFVQQTSKPEADSILYASSFVNMIQYMTALNAVVKGQTTSLSERFAIHDYAVSKLNIEELYTSGLWFYIIDGIVNINKTQEAFAEDMIKMLSRIKSLEVFKGLSDNLIIILNQYGWDDAFDIIIPYIIETGRIEHPQGNMYTAFTLAKLRRGMDAPAIEGLKLPLNKGKSEQTLLFFYESDCQNCILEMEKLKKDYSNLQSKKIRVISISADYEESEFKKWSDSLPWNDKLCDLKGFAGKNFSSYGILGTPTFFLLDKQNKIVGRFALYENVKF